MGRGLLARELVLKLLNFIISIGLIWGMFAAMHKFLPDTPMAWRDVAIGALVTTGLFQVGKYLIAL